jgi:TDG/mug DNA glycosylase family protein
VSNGGLRSLRSLNSRYKTAMNLLRPTRADLLAAAQRRVPDVIADDLRVLFCGINPGLYSAWSGHHFARPGNRFWPALHIGGFTKRLLRPSEERELLSTGCGITNIAARASASADELAPAELVAGGRKLVGRVRRRQPRFLAVLGVGAYRVAFGRPKAGLGLQTERIGETQIWVLPNPSGLNAHFQVADLGALFAELLIAAEE